MTTGTRTRRWFAAFVAALALMTPYGGFGLCLPEDRDRGCPCKRNRVCRSRRCVNGRCR